jgi:serine/threonine-protein kinase
MRAGRRAVQSRLPGSASDASARRLEVYRAGVEAALAADGTLPPQASAELRDLRRDLGIAEEQHRILLEVMRGEHGRAHGPLRPGQRLAGRYEALAVLGQGGHGTVLLARDGLLRREVVLKEVPAGGEAARGLAEARAAGALNHPNIVTVHDAVEGDRFAWLVMEHLGGGSLRDLLRAGPVPAADARRILDDLLRALEAAHARGIVHGDVKPENVLLDAEGRAKLGDFGSARQGPAGSATFIGLPSAAGPGTLLYMSPEQLQGAPPTPASDLYAAAAIAHELLTGRHYIELRGKGDFDVREAIVRGTGRVQPGSVPGPWRAWLERGLAADPGARWPTAAAMRGALPPARPALRAQAD